MLRLPRAEAEARASALLERVGLASFRDKYPALVKDVLDVMTALAVERMTMLVVTHEVRFARQVADRIVFMAGGEVLEEAAPLVFFSEPRHPLARSFVASTAHLA